MIKSNTPPRLSGHLVQTTPNNETSISFRRWNYAFSIALAILVLSPLFLLFGSCSSPEEEPQQPEETLAHYYIKYEVSFPNVYSQIPPTTSIRYVSENGEVSTSTQALSWDGTFGPFKPGTTVWISANCDMVKNLHTTIPSQARLSVCNGNGPFVLKAEMSKVQAETIYVSYTIQETD